MNNNSQYYKGIGTNLKDIMILMIFQIGSKQLQETILPLDIAVVKHFVWQVKRKLIGLPVDHHIMPILFGKSGGGKSVAIHKLVEPLKELTLETNMSVFQDQALECVSSQGTTSCFLMN